MAGECVMTDAVEVRRTPILLNEHTVALISLYILPNDHIGDLWTVEYQGCQFVTEGAVKQLVEQFEDRVSPRFLMELRKVITAKLIEWGHE
jgi:hypothetical protein